MHKRQHGNKHGTGGDAGGGSTAAQLAVGARASRIATSAAAFFAAFGADVAFANSTVPSLHAIPTIATGTPCGVMGNYTEKAPHALEACGYDGAAAAFRHLYGELRPPAAFDPAHLHRFNQREFDRDVEVGLDVNGGFVYVPAACRVPPAHRTADTPAVFHGASAVAAACGE